MSQLATGQQRCRATGDFTIRCIPNADGMHAEWLCETCGQSGQSAAAYLESSSALAWAKLAASVHHDAAHGECA
jgi:hypothetical protein